MIIMEWGLDIYHASWRGIMILIGRYWIYIMIVGDVSW